MKPNLQIWNKLLPKSVCVSGVGGGGYCLTYAPVIHTNSIEKFWQDLGQLPISYPVEPARE